MAKASTTVKADDASPAIKTPGAKHQRSPVVHSKCYSCQLKVVTPRGDYTCCQACQRPESDPEVKEIRTLSFCGACVAKPVILSAIVAGVKEVPGGKAIAAVIEHHVGHLKIYACQRQDGCWNKIRRTRHLAMNRIQPDKRQPSKKPKKSDSGDEDMDLDLPSPASPKKVKKPKAPKRAKLVVSTAFSPIFPPAVSVSVSSPAKGRKKAETTALALLLSPNTSKPNSQGSSPIPSYHSYDTDDTLFDSYSPQHVRAEEVDPGNDLSYFSPTDPIGHPEHDLFAAHHFSSTNYWPETHGTMDGAVMGTLDPDTLPLAMPMVAPLELDGSAWV